MAQGSFSAAVSDWVRETRERRDAVYRESAERVISVMQTPRGAGGNLRVDTGFLRASLVVTTSDALPMTIDKPDGDGAHSYDIGSTTLVIDGAEITDPILAVYSASYARHREYGARGQPGDRWVSLAAQQWGRIVEEVCLEARSRAGG